MSDPTPNAYVPPAAPGKTRVILQPDDKQVPSGYCDADPRTALSRGLKEYLEQLGIVWPSGRTFRFRRVTFTWATPEVTAEYPGACVYGSGDTAYEAERNVTVKKSNAIPGHPGAYLLEASEIAIELTVETYCNDQVERSAIVKMVEDGLSPTDWMYGVRLELPFYFNQRGTYELTGSSFSDSNDSAQRRLLMASFTVAATVVAAKVVGPLPPFTSRLVIEVEDGT